MNEPRPPTEEEWDATPQPVKDFSLSTIARLEDTIQKQQVIIERQQKTIEHLENRVSQLEERLKLNSSTPPSTDINKPKKKRTVSGKRKRGAQQGHEGKTRTLLPVEEVDEIVSCVPQSCLYCNHSFSGQKDEDPQRHQETDFPRVKPFVTEYQLHSLVCPCCHKKPEVSFPKV